MSIIPRLPGDVERLILSRLPVESVLVCKCVCKTWLTLISTPDFVEMHLNNNSISPRENNSTCLMFGSYEGEKKTTLIYSIAYHSLLESLWLPQFEDNDNNEIRGNNYVEIGDNDVEIEEEEEDSSSALSAGSGIEGYTVQLSYPFKFLGLTVDLFGSCNGVVCLWYHDDYRDDREDFFCLWNPATKDYKKISQAPERYSYSDIQLSALVYDPAADDYKFVFAVSFKRSGMNSLVYIYSLRSDSWKCFPTPHTFILMQKPGLLFNGELHWLTSNSIVSLDVTNEMFKEIQPPSTSLNILLVGVLEECLCVIVEDEDDKPPYDSAIEIWAMQIYGDPKSWIKRYTIAHKVMTKKILLHHFSDWRFMWSSKNGVMLFTDKRGSLVLYDPERDSAIERDLDYMSVENYCESLVSLNSYVGGSAYMELQILRNRNSVLEASNAELKACKAELKACKAELEARNVELERLHHEFQVAEPANSQKEAEEGQKKKGQKRKAEYPYTTRKASKAIAAMLSSPRGSTSFQYESLTVQQRAEEEQAKPAPVSIGSTLEPYQIKEGSKTRSTSKDSYETMTVESLRHILKQKGLKVTGKKVELIARLRGQIKQ